MFSLFIYIHICVCIHTYICAHTLFSYCFFDQKDRSRSKICLVNTHPAGHHSKGLKVFEFFDAFHVQGPTYSYSLRTCSGLTESTGRRASGFQIESIDGKVSLPLPSPIFLASEWRFQHQVLLLTTLTFKKCLTAFQSSIQMLQPCFSSGETSLQSTKHTSR